MDHSVALISTIAGAFGGALLFGFVAARAGLPPLLGYLLAGILIGPYTPGFVADIPLSRELAEIGVILLMFGVGLHFSLEDLMAVGRIAVPGAVAQIAVATALGAGLAAAWGWGLGAGLVFGLALSVASTVVLLRALEDRNALSSVNGQIAVGWLVVEDLAMVVVLVILPPLAGLLGGEGGGGALAPALAMTFGKLAVFVVLMLVVGRRVFPWLLWQVAKTGSRELFTLCVVATALGIAYGSAIVFGVSFALGAFFAGMVMRGSALSLRAAEESLPLRDAFSVLFFVSVGMLFDPAILVREPLRVLLVVLIIVFGKSLAAFLLVRAFRYPPVTALTVSASLAQIGEFSFILAGLGVALKLLPPQGQDLILAGALISIALNPVLFRAVDPLCRWLEGNGRSAGAQARAGDPLAELPTSVDASELTGHVLVVGHGRVGRRVVAALRERRVPVVVAEENRESVEKLRAEGVHAVSGDAAEPDVLIQAHVARAAILVIATPDTFKARKMIDVARMLKPDIEVVVRTHSDDEAELLRSEGASAFMGEHELAKSMAHHVLERAALRPGGMPAREPAR